MARAQSLIVLQRSGRELFSTPDIKKLLAVEQDNTLYKAIQRLVAAGILSRLTKGKYVLATAHPDQFEIANFLYSPSYVSFESALSFYGILIQAPFRITSATTLRALRLTAGDHEYEYGHISTRLFFDYGRRDGMLIATPEKALADLLYHACKGLRNVDVSELDLRHIDKTKFFKLVKKINYRPLDALVEDRIRR